MATEQPEPVDLAGVRRDDELIDALARGEVPENTVLTPMFAAYRDYIREEISHDQFNVRPS